MRTMKSAPERARIDHGIGSQVRRKVRLHLARGANGPDDPTCGKSTMATSEGYWQQLAERLRAEQARAIVTRVLRTADMAVADVASEPFARQPFGPHCGSLPCRISNMTRTASVACDCAS